MNHVITFITWRCSLAGKNQCPYCGYDTQPDHLSVKYRPAGRVFPVEREISGQQWLEIFKKFEPAVFDFCGGEATIHRDFPLITHGISNWAITSNTLGYSISELNLAKCHSWTASFHPHIGEQKAKHFKANVRFIREHGVPTSITIVARPDTVDYVLGKCEEFAAEGFHMNIHPYYDEPAFSWADYPDQWKKLTGSPHTRYDNKLMAWQGGGVGGKDKLCDGGRTYFCLSPDGRVFRCLWGMLSGLNEAIDDPQTDKWRCSLQCQLPCDFVYGLGVQPT